MIDYGYGSTSFVMPNVLAKLGADVLAVNPFASTARRDAATTSHAHAERVAGLVRASGAHLGAVIDPDGERLTLIDDEGHVLTDTEALLALLELVCRPPARRPGRPAGGDDAARRATVAARHGVKVQ